MSNRPVKKKKVVEITQEDFDVEWTPPKNSARDRIIQFGVLFLIIAFLLPAVTCAVVPDPETNPQQPIQQNPIEQQIKVFSKQLADNPDDAAALANLGYYTTIKAIMMDPNDPDNARMTTLVTAEKYLRDAVAKDPEFTFATAELGRNLMLQEKNDEAATLVEEALVKVEPKLSSEDETKLNEAKADKIKLLTLSAELDVRKKKFADALGKMTQAIEVKPGDAKLYLHRAQVYMTAGDMKAARADMEKGVDIGQKTGDQSAVKQGQQMIESLDKPQLEVIKMEEKDLTETPAPTPAE